MTTRETAADDTTLLTTKDLAELFRVSEAAIRKRIRLGQLGPAIRLGKGYVIRRQTLVRFLEGEEAKVGAGARRLTAR